ncbi:MAG: hypothetical protein P8178_10280 [Candidatus Thiodiazotropha sp.]
MYIPQFPEDSVLSRHLASAAEMQRLTWLQAPPSDSVLRRHAMSPASHPATPSAPARAAAPRRAAAGSGAAAPAPGAAEEKGFVAWLLGLFGHKA